jgi:FkbM family methyltransferase
MSDCLFARNVHGLYCIPKSAAHRDETLTILKGDVWEPDTIQFIIDRAEGGMVIHAGASYGDFLPALAAGCSQVAAFEPNREAHMCAEITLVLNRIENVALVWGALGAEHGTGTLATADHEKVPLGGASMMVDSDDSRKKETVPIWTIDGSVTGDIRVIHLDVEGYELEVLAGAVGTIERCSPVLVLEQAIDRAWFDEYAPGYRQAGTVEYNHVYQR